MTQPELVHSGKVRDVYRWNGSILLVASDRISAFDVILPTPVPGKGIALTQLSRFWFWFFAAGVPHHALAYEIPDSLRKPEWKGRITVCKPAKTIPMECVVRGYLAGSGWQDYQKNGTLQGHRLPPGLRESGPLPEPLFTPSTKAAAGHDEPLTEAEARTLVGDALYEELRRRSLELYTRARDYAFGRGIIIADTKFEFGHDADGNLLLIDEALTPDSSRFWPVDGYAPGKGQPSFDKQYVRDYLLSLPGWDRRPPGPELPREIVEGTRAKYLEAYCRLTGEPLVI